MTLFAAEDIARDAGVVVGSAALKVVLCAALKAKILRLYDVGL